MNKTLFLALIVYTTNIIFAMQLEQPYPLQNGTINGINIKDYLDNPCRHPQLHVVYILHNKKDIGTICEPITDENKAEAYKYIDEDNGIVCPTRSKFSKQLSVITRFYNDPKAAHFYTVDEALVVIEK